MFMLVVWSLIHWVTVTISVFLIGDRELLSGNLFSLKKIVEIAFHWRFIVAMISAMIARLSFMLINNNILKIPWLAQNSTTITAIISAGATIMVIIANYFFLGERINLTQGIGCVLVMAGLFMITVK